MNSSIISKAKRLMAMALVLAMMLTTLGGYAPGWFRAFAEEAGAEEQPQDSSASEREETPKQEEAEKEEAQAGRDPRAFPRGKGSWGRSARRGSGSRGK